LTVGHHHALLNAHGLISQGMSHPKLEDFSNPLSKSFNVVAGGSGDAYRNHSIRV
jgi:hypothetical protein